MISTGVFLFFFFRRCNIVNIKIICFILAHFNSFLIIIWFSSSSINSKKKFCGVPHLLHMCVIFNKLSLFCNHRKGCVDPSHYWKLIIITILYFGPVPTLLVFIQRDTISWECWPVQGNEQKLRNFLLTRENFLGFHPRRVSEWPW